MNNVEMIKIWIEKFKESLKNMEELGNFREKLPFSLRLGEIWDEISEDQRFHLINISILLGSYILSSHLFYPEFKFTTFLKEIFSILCFYGAIFCWFAESFSQTNIAKICLAVTTALSPIIFTNNSFGVAIVCLISIVLIEYVILSYMKGCRLFSSSVPVYVICETEQDFEISFDLKKKYKVLDFILLDETAPSHKSIRSSKLKTIQSIEDYLSKISRIPFFPVPRKFIYCSSQFNSNNLQKLLDIAVRYSVPVFKTNIFDNRIDGLCPITSDDLSKTPSATDKNPLISLFKSKNIWICYDGRKAISDLICLLSVIPSTHLTIICESESLVPKIHLELRKKGNGKHHKIKVSDLPFLCMSETIPDVLFYNMPIRSHDLGEDGLKGALVKNVIDTESLIKLSQNFKIPMVFVLSNLNSLNANDWSGATQRLGELLCQYADFQHRKTYSKFRVIRVPETPEDSNGTFEEISSSLLVSGKIYLDSAESDHKNLYDPKEVEPLLIKAIALAYKSENNAEALTVMPKEKISLDNLIKKVCDLFYLEKDRDVPIIYNHKNENMELDNFPNISENLERTSVANVLVTKFVVSSVGSYSKTWTVEEVSKMNPREIIAAVFQSLSEKISKKSR